MKKHLLIFAAARLALGRQAANYGILVNGTTYFAGEPVGEYEGFQQYLAHVQVSSGDQLQLYDVEYQSRWAVPLNTYSVAGFTYDATNNRYNVNVDGCYDFYIKLKYEQDELYIGNGSNCGDGEDVEEVYRGAVPRQCEAVMMQAFYNEPGYIRRYEVEDLDGASSRDRCLFRLCMVAAECKRRRGRVSPEAIQQPELELGYACRTGDADSCVACQ